MNNKLGEKFGQIDLHKAPKKSSFGETFGAIALAVAVIVILANVFG